MRGSVRFALAATVTSALIGLTPTAQAADDCALWGSLASVTVEMTPFGWYARCGDEPDRDPRASAPLVITPEWGGRAFASWYVSLRGSMRTINCASRVLLNGKLVAESPLTPAKPISSGTDPWGAVPLHAFADTESLTSVASVPTRSGSVEATIDCGPDGKATVTRSLVITPSPPPGRDPGVSIEDGADYTNSSRVNLYLGWEKGQAFDKVKVSNDGGFAPSKTKEFDLTSSGPISWQLVDLGKERLPKTVYLKFRVASAPQYWYPQVYTDDIILDTVKPQVLSASMSGSGAATLAGPRMVRVKARDNRSGLASVQVSAGKPNKKAKVRKFRKSVPAPKSSRVFVRVRDGAGNWSKWKVAG